MVSDEEWLAREFDGQRAAVIDGVPGLVWIVDYRPKVVWEFTTDGDPVVRIDMVAAPDTLTTAEIETTS